MAYSPIDKSSLHFKTHLYTGNGSTNAQTGVGFQPDWCWIKQSNGTSDHVLYDVVRGVTKNIHSNTNDTEDTQSDGLTAFGTDGFTVGADSKSNANSGLFAAHCWKAGNSQGSSNTDGSINTTYTSVNSTAGFSISKYTGTGSVGTIGHGLGAVPDLIMVKRLDSASDWRVFHVINGNTKQLFLNDTNARDDDNTIWNDTSPTSSVFTVGTNTGGNASGGTYVAYCFTHKPGFSKFGFYKGSGSSNGPFIYTGFKPAFIIVKNYEQAVNWMMWNSARNPVNKDQFFHHHPNTQDTWVDNYNRIDILSNGFKIRQNNINATESNNTNYDHVFWAFGQTLVGSNNVPCTAR